MQLVYFVLFIFVVLFVTGLGLFGFSDLTEIDQITNVFFFGHIITALAAYVSFSFSFILGLVYLFQDRQLKKHQLGIMFQKIPSLDVIERWVFRGLLLGLPLLTVALLSGFFWMKAEFDTFWLWNSKLISSVFAWIVYTVLFYFHFISSIHGRKLIFLNVLAFLMIIITFLGMNLFESQILQIQTQ